MEGEQCSALVLRADVQNEARRVRCNSGHEIRGSYPAPDTVGRHIEQGSASVRSAHGARAGGESGIHTVCPQALPYRASSTLSAPPPPPPARCPPPRLGPRPRAPTRPRRSQRSRTLRGCQGGTRGGAPRRSRGSRGPRVSGKEGERDHQSHRCGKSVVRGCAQVTRGEDDDAPPHRLDGHEEPRRERVEDEHSAADRLPNAGDHLLWGFGSAAGVRLSSSFPARRNPRPF